MTLEPPEAQDSGQNNGHAKNPPAAGTTSAHLQQLNREAALRGSLSIREMLETMGTSSIAFTILVLSLPALTPIPGPFGMVFGTCLAIVSLQIIFGASHLKLPNFVGNRRMSAAMIALIVRHSAPSVGRIERMLLPGRLRKLAGPAAQQLLGIPVFLLAVAIALPIPFGNFLPVIALVVIAMALLESDGFAIAVGLVLSVLALSVTVGLIFGAISATTWIAA